MTQPLAPPVRPAGRHARRRLRLLGPRFFARASRRVVHVNASSEHALYLVLFVSNSGGW